MDPFQQETAGSADADEVIDPTTGALVKIITELTNGGNVALEGCDFQAHCSWDTRVVALNLGVRSTFYC